MSRASAGRSSAPPGCIGVTIATRLPETMKCGFEKTRILPDSLRSGTPRERSTSPGVARVPCDACAQVRRPRARRADGREPLHDGAAARRRRAPARTRRRSARPRTRSRATRLRAAGNRDSTGGRSARCPTRTSRTAARRRASSASTQLRRAAADAGSWRRRSRRSASPASGHAPSSRSATRVSTPATSRKRRERVGIAIDGEHARAARREEACVPAVAGRDIEDPRAARHQMREALDPGGGRGCRDPPSSVMAASRLALAPCRVGARVRDVAAAAPARRAPVPRCAALRAPLRRQASAGTRRRRRDRATRGAASAK